eukprot:6189920-Prymnesium_polylepis.1
MSTELQFSGAHPLVHERPAHIRGDARQDHARLHRRAHCRAARVRRAERRGCPGGARCHMRSEHNFDEVLKPCAVRGNFMLTERGPAYAYLHADILKISARMQHLAGLTACMT